MTWLITGDQGFIGSRLKMAVGPMVQGCDLRSECDAVWLPKSTDVDCIAHLAAESGIQACANRPRAAFSNNVASLSSVLEIARVQGSYVAFASSSAAAAPTNPYAAHKAAGEALCDAYMHTYHITLSVLRLSNVYGPGSWHKSSVVAAMCRQALTEGIVTIDGDGTQKRDFVYVDDVCAAILSMPEGRWGVRTGTLTSVAQVAGIIAELSGVGIRYGDRRPFDVEVPVDHSPILDLDYRKLSDGLEETWKWFKLRDGG